MADKVVYASSDVTLHEVRGSEEVNGNTSYNVDSVNLAAGDSVDFDSLPPYQQEAVEAGKVPGVQVVSKSEADKLNADRAKFLESLGLGAPDANFQTVDPNDGSFNDHEVSDAERVANHAARAKAEAGEAGPSDEKVTVAGAESDTSPATDGRTTDPDVVAEEVQGTAGADSAAKESKSKSKSDK